MTFPQANVVNAGIKYINGLQLNYLVIPSTPISSYVAGKAIIVQPGQCRDHLDINDIYLPQQLVYSSNPPSLLVPPPTPYVLNGIPVGCVINGLQTGVNGVDVGVLAASSLYAVYAIGSSVSVFTYTNQLGGGPSPNPLGPIAQAPPVNPYAAAGLLSLVSNATNPASTFPLVVNPPVLPYGYDMYRLIGWVATGSGALIDKFWNYDVNDQVRTSYYDVPLAAATTTASTTYATLILTSNGMDSGGYDLVPPVPAGTALLNVTYTPATAGNVASFLPVGSTSTGAGVVQIGASGSVAVPYGLDALGQPALKYKTTAGGDTLTISVAGFISYL